MDKESAKLKMKTCTFCNQLDYGKLKCVSEKEGSKVENKRNKSIEDKLEVTVVKGNQLKMSIVERKEQ